MFLCYKMHQMSYTIIILEALNMDEDTGGISTLDRL